MNWNGYARELVGDDVMFVAQPYRMEVGTGHAAMQDRDWTKGPFLT